jgi:hypothetical protein
MPSSFQPRPATIEQTKMAPTTIVLERDLVKSKSMPHRFLQSSKYIVYVLLACRRVVQKLCINCAMKSIVALRFKWERPFCT